MSKLGSPPNFCLADLLDVSMAITQFELEPLVYVWWQNRRVNFGFSVNPYPVIKLDWIESHIEEIEQLIIEMDQRKNEKDIPDLFLPQQSQDG